VVATSVGPRRFQRLDGIGLDLQKDAFDGRFIVGVVSHHRSSSTEESAAG